MKSFTRGPWDYTEGKTLLHIQQWTDTDRGRHIASVPKADKANARLISVAPELLEACRSAETEVNKWHSLNVVDNDKPNQDNAWKCLTKIRKAIKKAEEA